MTTQALRVPEVARRLSLSPCAVYVAIQRGELPALRLGRAVRVLESDLDAFIEQHRQAPSEWDDAAVAALLESIE